MASSITYNDGSVKESVLNLISVINPDETQLLNSLQRTKALGPVHQFLKQDLNAVDSTQAGNVEGAALVAASTTDPVRLTNYTQIFQKGWGVTGTQKASAHYAKDAKARAMDQALREIGNDIEFALMRGAASVAGTVSTARKLKGVKSWITTNATAGVGVAFTQPILDQALQGTYDAGGKIDTLYVGGVMKRKIDAFTANNTRQISASDQKLVASISVYVSSFGVIKIELHRYVTFTGDTNNDIVGLDTKRWGIAVLRDPKNVDVAITTDGETGAFVGELTLEARNEKSSMKLTNYI